MICLVCPTWIFCNAVTNYCILHSQLLPTWRLLVMQPALSKCGRKMTPTSVKKRLGFEYCSRVYRPNTWESESDASCRTKQKSSQGFHQEHMRYCMPIRVHSLSRPASNQSRKTTAATIKSGCFPK